MVLRGIHYDIVIVNTSLLGWWAADVLIKWEEQFTVMRAMQYVVVEVSLLG